MPAILPGSCTLPQLPWRHVAEQSTRFVGLASEGPSKEFHMFRYFVIRSLMSFISNKMYNCLHQYQPQICLFVNANYSILSGKDFVCVHVFVFI